MNKKLGRLFTLSILCFGIVTCATSAAAPTTQPLEANDRQRADKIVRLLDSPDPENRNAASLQINNLGADALEPIESAVKDDDTPAETRVRLQVALKYIRPRAIAERAARARAAWESELLVSAYLGRGHTNPKFDTDAGAAIRGYLALGPDPLHAPADKRNAVLALFEKACDAGCDDPMVLVLYALADGHPGGPERFRAQPLATTKAFYAFNDGNYPPATKFRVEAQLGSTRENPSVSLLRRLTAGVASTLQSPGIPPDEVDTLISWFLITPTFSDSDSRLQFEALADAYETLRPASALPLLARARTSQLKAWTLRQSLEKLGQFDGPAMKDYTAALKEAAAFGRKAYERDPADSRTARWMVTFQFQLGEESDNLAEFDIWFDLAIQQNPDDRSAWETKGRYLSPEVRGSVEEMIAFSHECLASQNWRAGIPFVAVSIHDRCAELSGDRQAYFLKPETWTDVKAAFEGELVNYPDHLVRRCEFAKYAGMCGQWDIAKQQFDIIGDHPTISVFGSEESYKYLRRKAERLAKPEQ